MWSLLFKESSYLCQMDLSLVNGFHLEIKLETEWTCKKSNVSYRGNAIFSHLHPLGVPSIFISGEIVYVGICFKDNDPKKEKNSAHNYISSTARRFRGKLNILNTLYCAYGYSVLHGSFIECLSSFQDKSFSRKKKYPLLCRNGTSIFCSHIQGL